MAAKVIWSPRAVTDLEDTCNYIARDSQRYASVFASTILTLVKQNHNSLSGKKCAGIW